MENSAGSGAAVTSSVIAAKVCFQEAAKLLSTTEMGRNAVMMVPSNNSAVPDKSTPLLCRDR
jgi:hypothetical protein